MKSTTRLEIDVIRCTRTYGTSPCNAMLGETGAQKCYNTHGTCQDLANFDPVTQTLKFSKQSIDGHIPSIASYTYTPAQANPGEDMGSISSVAITFKDHPHHDADLDPYVEDRGKGFWEMVSNPVQRYTAQDSEVFTYAGSLSHVSGSENGVIVTGNVSVLFVSSFGMVCYGEDFSRLSIIGILDNTTASSAIHGDEIVCVGQPSGSGQPYVLQYTNDYGKSWTVIDIEDKTGVNLRIYGVLWSESKEKWLIYGNDRDTDSSVHLFSTEDFDTFAEEWSAGYSAGAIGVFGEYDGVIIGSAGPGAIVVDDGAKQEIDLSATIGSEVVTGAAYDGNIYVLVGTNGLIVTSPNLSTWTRRDDETGTDDYLSVLHDGEQFVASGDSRLFKTSENGIDWEDSEAPWFPVFAGGEYLPLVRGLTCFYVNGKIASIGSGDNRLYIKDPDVFFDPRERGTYWGKFIARFPYLAGYECRLYRGFDDDEVPHHFIIEGFGFSRDQFTIKAKSPLKLAQGKRAQCPRVSNGTLSGAIDEDDSSFTLAETGLGDIEYPASGWIAVGDEIMSFTRSGDTFSLSGRGQLGTIATAHEEGDLVQIVHRFDSMTVAEILKELLEDFAGLDSSYIPFSEWEEEANVINRNYSAHIAKPTPVEDLINELINQCGLVFWFDDRLKEIKIRALRPPGVGRLIDETEIMKGTFRWDEQPDKRVSQVWTRYSQINPLEDDDDEKNFAAGLATVDADKEALYGSPRIRKIFSRWFAVGGSVNAQRVNDLILSRYVDSPKRFQFSLFATSEPPAMGETIAISHPDLQDAQGGRRVVKAIVTKVEVTEDRANISAEEFTYKQRDSEESEFGREVPIDVGGIYDSGTGQPGINARVVHDSIYTSPPTDTSIINIIVYPGVMRGAPSATFRALDIGEWPDGCTVNLHIRQGASIRGAGGAGGSNGGSGQAGGIALYTRFPVNITNDGAIIGGGGGGGAGGSDVGDEQSNFATAGGGGGGGGAGYVPGSAGAAASIYNYNGTNGTSGTQDAGGSGGAGGRSATFPQVIAGNGGAGGAPGQPGTAGSSGLAGPPGGLGGAAGAAVDGDSYVTWATLGTIVGPRVN